MRLLINTCKVSVKKDEVALERNKIVFIVDTSVSYTKI